MLVGDAARLTDACTGGGIGNALFTGTIAGELAGRVVSQKMEDVARLAAYDTLWRKHIERGLDILYRAKGLMSLPDGKIDAIIRLLKVPALFFNTVPTKLGRLRRGLIARTRTGAIAWPSPRW